MCARDEESLRNAYLCLHTCRFTVKTIYHIQYIVLKHSYIHRILDKVQSCRIHTQYEGKWKVFTVNVAQTTDNSCQWYAIIYVYMVYLGGANCG